jgi:hypothetical protein
MGSGPVFAVERPTFDVSSGFRYNSNLSNADRASDVEDDFFWRADARKEPFGGGACASVWLRLSGTRCSK